MCDHEFIYIDNSYICELCGLVNELIEQSNFDTHNYTVNISNDNLYNTTLDYIKNVDKKNKIINYFEHIIDMYEKKIRGVNKKAILAVIVFYVLQDIDDARPAIDIWKMFNITKKKFGDAKKIVLNEYSEYRTLTVNISSFVNIVCIKYPVSNIIKDKVILFSKHINYNENFVNYSPYNVCACILVYYIKNDKNFKKNIFLKKIGMSEVIFNDIFQYIIIEMNLNRSKKYI